MLNASSDFKKSLYLNFGIIAVVIAVFALFYILLELNIQKQITTINDIKSKKATASESAENLSVLIKEWATAKNYSQQVALLVPSKDDLVSLQKDINNIARTDNVSLGFNFGLESAGDAGSLGNITFKATVDGTSDGILNFLKDVENKYYSLKINVLELNVLSGGLLRLTMSGQIFYDTSNQ
jgi:hypothetical protein